MKTTTSLLGAAIVAALLIVPSTLRADATAAVDITPRLRASGLDIENLRGIEVGGIVILRGRTADAAAASHAGAYVQQLGYTRVANLIEVVPAPDDARIERTAERQLALQRSLQGCNLHVDSDHGVVTVVGKVNSELQKDVALDIVRNIDGVRSVRAGFRD
jgi:osmotically-inducible protein OsmY